MSAFRNSNVNYDIAIIGGGIIGLSTAWNIQNKFPQKSITILEKEPQIAQHQTGHNSGVIHSGIYYKPNSKKAKTCRAGIFLLEKFCKINEIPFKKCGKVIVATKHEELPNLQKLYENGKQNNLQGLEIIQKDQLREIEQNTAGIQALLVPETGVVDYTKVSQKLAEIIEKNGGKIQTGFRVIEIKCEHKQFILRSSNEEITANFLINASGLYSDRIARMASVQTEIQIIPFRGEYFRLNQEGEKLVNTLIYPVPNPSMPFLGVHFTKNIAGEVSIGPSAVLALAREGYRKMDIQPTDLAEILTTPAFWKLIKQIGKFASGEILRSFSKKAFVKAAQKMVPAITTNHIAEFESGVRAQAISKDGQLLDDFAIVQVENQIHILNAPSPAATASLAIGKSIADLIH